MLKKILLFYPSFENATTEFPCDYQFWGIKK